MQKRTLSIEVPYGLRIAPDGRHLEEEPKEMEIMLAMLDGLVRDRRFSEIATDLNERGFRNREDALWTQAAVFDMLPRLIECSPRMFPSEEWAERRRALMNYLNP
jgi:hypothetical protein